MALSIAVEAQSATDLERAIRRAKEAELEEVDDEEGRDVVWPAAEGALPVARRPEAEAAADHRPAIQAAGEGARRLALRVPAALRPLRQAERAEAAEPGGGRGGPTAGGVWWHS